MNKLNNFILKNKQLQLQETLFLHDKVDTGKRKAILIKNKKKIKLLLKKNSTFLDNTIFRWNYDLAVEKMTKFSDKWPD